jgi:membrane-associated phospholipid phosphatase
LPPIALSSTFDASLHASIAPETDRSAIPGRWLVLATIAGLVLLTLMMEYERLSIALLSPAALLFGLVLAALGTVRHAFRNPTSHGQRIARDMAEYFGIFTLMTLTGALASYPVSAMTSGFVDEGLERADAILHFDWIAWYNLVAEHRSLQIIGTAFYQSIYASPAILLGWFAWTNKRAAARRFIASFWIAAVLALVLFRFMPAVGPFATLAHGPVPYMPDSGLWMDQLIPELRLHLVHVIDLGAIRGLVSAPSFHTASAVLFIAAAWPYRALRWPLLALNLGMLISTPVEGTHYLSDMILGAAVAGVALGAVAALSEALSRRSGDWQPVFGAKDAATKI